MASRTGALRKRLRAAMRAERPAFGTFIKISDRSVIDLCSSAKLDFIVIDGEHSQLPLETICNHAASAAAVGLAALVRLPEVNAGVINRVLEAGAAGVQLSSVRSRSQVLELIKAVNYEPVGARSISMSHLQADYGAIPLTQYLSDEREEPPILVVQIESPDRTDPLERILSGTDVAFLGPTDMSVALGLDGRTDATEFHDQERVLRDASERVGIIAGSWVSDLTSAGEAETAGDRYIVVGSDVQNLGAALRHLGTLCDDKPSTDH